MARDFPVGEWAPADPSRVSTSEFTTAGSDDVFDPKGAMPPSRFQNRQRSLPFGPDVGTSNGLVRPGLTNKNPPQEDGKRGHGFLGFMRRASVSIKRRQRRHSHASHAIEERPQTASTPWHRLRQAASFNRNSKYIPSQVFELDASTTSSEEFLAPIPGRGNAPPIIPRGSGGEAARATAAAQNELLFGRHHQLHQLEDRESGIGIAVASPDTVEAIYDPSISRVDFIAELPVELAIQILARLDHLSLIKTSLVSKMWNRVSSSSHIWREAFIREKSKTYAMSHPVPLGAGLGLPAVSPDHDWKDLYRTKHELEQNWAEGDFEAIYLHGHTDSIYCVQFDEYKIITGSRDKTIRVWDMKTYACTLIIGPPNAAEDCNIMTGEEGKPVHYATMSPDDTPITQSTPLAITYPIHHNQSILCLQYDENILVTGSSDSTCIVYDIKDNYRSTKRLVHHAAAVLDLAFDERYIVTCSKDVSICVWDRESGALLKQLRGHAGPVNAVQMRDNMIVSCSGDFKVKLWNIDTGKNIREFTGHNKGLACSQFSDDSKYIASAGNDQMIRIWDANTGECRHEIEAHDNLVRSLHIDSISGRLISGSYDQDIKVFDMETGNQLLNLPNWHSSWVLSAKSDYRRLISTGQNPKILILDFGLKIKGIDKLESKP
ncbi:WD40 repeat-like protein [Venustampulla echinocandica]|uniref:WD40 repeat-like protein n=1 Tax=Venustampulla echinocandica TaxID=2656787 RepID=A0A370TY59_9HELO|nr:WD40 repeat-like protein [Venustampulla echinocandica]RDL40467.1 WD40 repeat-like protein [Venustampulla echinocandica]